MNLVEKLNGNKTTAHLMELIRFAMNRIEEAQLKQVASSLTLTTLLSIVPALAVIMAAFAAFSFFEPYRESFEQFLFSTLLPESYSAQIMEYLKNFATKATGLTIFGVLGMFVSALLCISTIDTTLNRTFKVKRLRKPLNRFLLYWALITIGPIVLSMSLAASSYVTGMAITGHLSKFDVWIYPVIQWLLQGILLSVLYRFVPNCKVLWRDALISGLLFSLIMSVFRWGFGVYVTRGSYNNIYGAFAAIPVFLTWMYVMWMLVLSGAALTASLPMLRASRYPDFNKVGNNFLTAVALLKLLKEAKDNNQPHVSEQLLANQINSYPEQVDAILSRLVNRHYVVRLSETKATKWALLADCSRTNLQGVFEEFCVDMSNSLLTQSQSEKAWIEEAMAQKWLASPMSESLQAK